MVEKGNLANSRDYPCMLVRDIALTNCVYSTGGGYVLRATFRGPTLIRCCGVPGDVSFRKGQYPEQNRGIGYTHGHGPDHLLILGLLHSSPGDS